LREKSLQQEYLDYSRKSSVKVVREYRRKYQGISDVLEINPKILNLAHKDFSDGLSESEGGRRGYTSEQILRSLIVMFIEGDSFRDVVVRIENSEFFQSFVKLGVMPMMDYSFMCKAYGVLREKTWKAMNEALSVQAQKEEKITGEKVRVDSTAYETNIHHPTDSSLLRDSFRTLARLMNRSLEEMRLVGLSHRFHVKKVKKLAYFISRNSNKNDKRTKKKIKSTYRKLIDRVNWITEVGWSAKILLSEGSYKARVVSGKLEHYIPIVEKIIDQAERRVFKGEKVPSVEKVYSLFEDHTELIKRGKAGKPIEFGHKVLLAETGEKFILHYSAMPKQRADKDLLDETIKAHGKIFNKAPEVLAADKGFYESREQLAKLSEKIKTVSICKKGRRTAEEDRRESTKEFKEGQRFRAGVEGTISVLKRAFKLDRCLFRGFKNYAASLGCAVFCHNLVLLARL
jgi:IS5 family transposase